VKHAPCWIWIALALAAAGLGTLVMVFGELGGPPLLLAADPGARAGGPPPLKVDKSAPLLLDEPKGPPKDSGKQQTENDVCYVCHANYKEEPLVVWHGKDKVGCMKCHGESLAHRNDEDNITPPDVMFPLDKLDKACKECHAEHNASAAKVIALWQKQCPTKTNSAEIVCTDCHGKHRLERRTIRWDRKTRALTAGKAAISDAME
jgi:formate-dependent nitrite reductase cytochrome c552 subunit